MAYIQALQESSPPCRIAGANAACADGMKSSVTKLTLGTRLILAVCALVLVCAPAGALAADLNTVLVGTWRSSSWINAMAVQGNYAFLLEELAFHVIDVSNPANPQRIGDEICCGLFWALAVSGNYAY